MGTNLQFFVNSEYDAKGRTQVNAALRYVGARAYFFVEDPYFATLTFSQQQTLLDAVENLSAEFDATIYPGITEIFGPLYEPGIDGESRVFVLLMEMPNAVGGYVNTADEYLKTAIVNGEANTNSNEKELVYFNALHVASQNAPAFLAHEAQHLVTFNMKDRLLGIQEDVWLNEVRSEYAPTALGYDTPYQGSNLASRVSAFLASPADSLTAWDGKNEDYASVSLFGQYVSSRFGSAVLPDTLDNEHIGIASVEEEVREREPHTSFHEVILDWAITNAINDPDLEAGRFSYKNPSLAAVRITQARATYIISESVDLSFERTVDDWAGEWVDLLPVSQGPFAVSVSSADPEARLRAAAVLSFTDGTHAVQFFDRLIISEASATLLIDPPSGGALEKLTLVFMNGFEQADFSDTPAQATYSVEVTAAAESAPPVPQILQRPSGTLLRAAGDPRVWITKGAFRRHLARPEIFALYPHLRWEDIITVDAEELALYRESFWVRTDGDTKVYELNADLTKHWVNMTAEQFTFSGRAWEAVFIINTAERDFYAAGADVLFR